MKKHALRDGTVLAVVLLGSLLAFPSFLPTDPALLVRHERGTPIEPPTMGLMTDLMTGAGAPPAQSRLADGVAEFRFANAEAQRRAGIALGRELSEHMVTFAAEPRLPRWAASLGLRPVRLGLDLRGGLQFKYEVALEAVARRQIDDHAEGLRRVLRDAGVRASVDTVEGGLAVRAGERETVLAARRVVGDLAGPGPDSVFTVAERRFGDGYGLLLTVREDTLRARQDAVMRQNVATLRNRVNELGLAEPVVARLGFDHILVQVPGARDPAQVRRILTSTATVQWHLEDTSVDAAALTRGGSVPSGSMLRADAEGRPVALYREMIVSGEQLDDATFMYVEGKPVVSIELDAAGAQRMLDVTQRNVGRPLAVLLIEETRPPPTATEETPRARTANVEARSAAMPSDGANARARRDETVIFVGRIANVFSSTFQLTGLGAVEAQDLAILLRSGALAAPIYEVQHGAVSPTLGQDNIDRGRTALVVGFVSVIAFMAGYYRGFGWIANLALVANLALMIGTLSVLPAALTLPGLAGIVLTVGMAVDANVLIFERIRESLAAGTSPRAAIDEGYRRAFATIADANVTTLIAAIGLFAFGSGPILGFAVTLGLGIVTSMFTAVVGTRVVVDLVYSRRRPARLSIGRVRMPEAREPADD